MKDFSKYIIEKLRVSKHVSSEINLDTFNKNSIKVYCCGYIPTASISYNGKVEVTYYVIEDKSGNIIGGIELFEEGGLTYTLILQDDTYDYFCTNFKLEEDEEYGPICPEKVYDALFYTIPDFSGDDIYLTSISMWADARENFLKPDDYYYDEFKNIYKHIIDKLYKQ